MTYTLMFCYCLFLVVLQVFTGWALMHGDAGGPVTTNIGFLFFGLNLPTIILGSQLSRKDSSEVFKSPAGCLVMALIMANFMRAGALSGGWEKWNGILHILSAQSLWIAVPTCLALGRRSF